MSILEFRSQKPEKPKNGSMLREALHIIDTEGVDEVHDIIGQRYIQGEVTLKALKQTRYSIGLVLALNEEEYYSYVEHIFELDYALDILRETYKQTKRNDVIGNAVCLTLLPRIVEILDWVDTLYGEISARWEEGRDLNVEVGPLFIQVSDHLGLDEEEFSVDYENLLNISRSTARYLTAELVNGTMIIKAYNEKKEALMAIMSSKTLNSSNLITRY